ncbi:MAG TPA: hypothetical protein VFX84_00740 [Candidatus Saccharimonadales bacterium]|nr:hypothetical protein [Candidatus Saccharimonadales bacterium]
MAAQQEQLGPQAAQAAPAQSRPVLLTPEQRQADGDRAYEEARERQRAHGLDEETVRLYTKASYDLMAAEVHQLRHTGRADPHIMLRRAASMAWQAEATPYGVFYERPHGHVDVRSNLQELAMKELNAANDILLGRNAAKPEAIETTSISPGLVAEVAAEAAGEAGTAEHVLPEQLEAGGVEGIEHFIGEQAMSGEHGPMFTALVADKEDTGIHELPLAA